MVEVFKTNVNNNKVAKSILSLLKREFPNYKINFDLEDCDKILRIEGEKISNESIISHLYGLGFVCLEL